MIFLLKFLLKNCFKFVVFPFGRQDPVLELQIVAIYGAVGRNSIVFRSSLAADLSGAAPSRFFVAAAASVILVCFAAESCKSHCNGGVKVTNPALVAIFFDFGNIHFPFENPFKKRFKIDVFPLWRRNPLLRLRVAIFNFGI